MWFRNALQFAHDQRRDYRAILRHLMFPPANRQIAAERLAIIEIRSNHRSFKIDTLFHITSIRARSRNWNRCVVGPALAVLSFVGPGTLSGSSRITPR